jgi:hypothetical protein
MAEAAVPEPFALPDYGARGTYSEQALGYLVGKRQLHGGTGPVPQRTAQIGSLIKDHKQKTASIRARKILLPADATYGDMVTALAEYDKLKGKLTEYRH